jgi:hypothetical protein
VTSLRVRSDVPADALKGLDAVARRKMGPVATQLGKDIVEIAVRITREELVNDRENSRRSTGVTNAGKASRDHEHYIDSFKVGAPDLSGGRVRVVVRNTHPAAHILEFGADPHDIEPQSGPLLVFPYHTTRRGGGDYARGGGRPFKSPLVDHPGTPRYEILTRARQEAQGRKRRVKMLVKASLAR